MFLKKIITFISTIAFIFLLSTPLHAQNSDKIYFFYGTGCPHCSRVEEFFEKENIYNDYPVDKRDIYSSPKNALLFNSLLTQLGVAEANRGVPAVVIGTKALVGDKNIIANFISDAEDYKINKDQSQAVSENKQESQKQPSNLTLAAVIAGSLVDAINPCEFAVLIILLTTILATGKAKKALKAGLLFSISIFISYFLMGLGLYKALSLGGFSVWFLKVIGTVAVVLGLANLKDYFWYGKGFLMEVPHSWRPKLKKLINSVTSPLGAFAIGFVVSLFLLPCTSGPYIVILGMLANKVTLAKTISYLLLYNLIFVSPMVLITLAVYKGFNPARAEEMRQKRLRVLHLIAGIIMIAMGIVILAGWV